MLPRASGILLHPTSLPGPYGIGDLGESAYRFIDFLVEARQHCWQVLPLGPTGYANSPYDARSSFAGNELLIALDLLVEAGLLGADDVGSISRSAEPAANYHVAQSKLLLFRRAYYRFLNQATAQTKEDFSEFRDREASWLEDYALYRTLSAAHHGQPWDRWDDALVRRRPAWLEGSRRRFHSEIEFHCFVQYLFFSQWSTLKRYAAERGVRIIGDLPIFVSHDSADVWAHQELFILDPNARPAVVAGVPPDLFSETGQRWGNPCYCWEMLRDTGYRWWIDRFRRTLELTDTIRIDHFRGFVASWQIPAEETTAIRGEWVPGPGRELFERVTAELGSLPVIVEDLGIITEDVVELRKQLGYPGMKVLQFAFGSDHRNPYLPHNYEANFVVYTGTHDNDTSRGWFESCSPWERDHVRRYLGVDGREIHWDLIRLALSSVAATAIVPLQDVLGLGHAARMNVPGQIHGNWRWRYRDGDLTSDHAGRLADLTTQYGRT